MSMVIWYEIKVVYINNLYNLRVMICIFIKI